jgi:phosphoglycerate dehydrogenase-like enzyme
MSTALRFRCAILNDYQRVALAMGDWGGVAASLDITIFDRHLGGEDAVAEALLNFDIVVLMRERTPFPASLFARLPRLKLLVTTGRRNPSVDIEAAAAHGVAACGTGSLHHPTAELTWGLILALLRHIPLEDQNLRHSGPWQRTVGTDLKGKTLGVLGLGHLGAQVAKVGLAFGMEVIAWSQNLTAARCAEVGVRLTDKAGLLAEADVLSIHTNLSRRTTGLIGAAELQSMKPTSVLVNTSRGFIVDEAALIEAVQTGQIAGCALDVFDVEPLPDGHPLRSLPNTVLTPHLGYVTEDNYRLFFTLVVEDIRAWLNGAPVRLLRPDEQLDRSQ